MRNLWKEIWGFIFWTHERASVRYDIMVALILAFIFLTPRGWFTDRSPQPRPMQIEALAEGGYRIDARLLSSEINNLDDAAGRLLQTHTGKKKVRIRRMDTVLGSEGRPEAYRVWIEP